MTSVFNLNDKKAILNHLGYTIQEVRVHTIVSSLLHNDDYLYETIYVALKDNQRQELETMNKFSSDVKQKYGLNTVFEKEIKNYLMIFICLWMLLGMVRMLYSQKPFDPNAGDAGRNELLMEIIVILPWLVLLIPELLILNLIFWFVNRLARNGEVYEDDIFD